MSPLTRTFVSTAALARATSALTSDLAHRAVDLRLQGASAVPAVARADHVDAGPIAALLFVLEKASQELGAIGGPQCGYLLCQLLNVCLGARHDCSSVPWERACHAISGKSGALVTRTDGQMTPGYPLAAGLPGIERFKRNRACRVWIDRMTRDAPVIPLPLPAGAPRAAELRLRGDDDLMRLCAAGVLEPFTELVTRHEPQVRAFCARMLASPAHGDDVAQEVFLEIWRTRARYQPRGRFRAFLFTAARNRCLRALRDRSRARAVPGVVTQEAPPADTSGQLEALLAAERRQRLRDLIARLPPKLRDAVWLRFAGELGYAEIAAIIRRPEETVRSRVFLGLKRLRQMLGDDAEERISP
jgi:RNA polymerase sigma-70 factor (ECF subfamily)